jgi:hypothetical protein
MVVFLIGSVLITYGEEPLEPQYEIQMMGTFSDKDACLDFLYAHYSPHEGPNILQRERSDKLVYEDLQRRSEAQIGPVGTFCAPVDFNE